MQEGELELTEDTAARLITQRFPAFALLPLQRVGAAQTARRFRVHDALE